MKKILFVILLFSSCYGAEIISTLIPSENRGYFILSDGTYWKVTTFVKRWRTALEWVSGEELYVPDNYLTDLEGWALGDEFEAYSKYGALRVDESAASNEHALKTHTHLLINPRTGKVLFATPLYPTEFLSEIYYSGYNNGYSSGYSAGYSQGYSSGQASIP